MHRYISTGCIGARVAPMIYLVMNGGFGLSKDIENSYTFYILRRRRIAA